MANTYDESSFKVLRGLEPVRQRPGMYTNLESPNHLIAEVVDNACDEALALYARNITVTAHTDGSVTVLDDGRGIPVGLHAEEGVSVVEVAFTVLHSGGKFDKDSGGAYKFAGGLHGVGVAVTNALSSRVEVTVYRDGGEYFVRFLNGTAEAPLAQIGSCAKKRTSTMVRAWPNPKYFDAPNVNLAQFERSLRSKAVLLPGVNVTLHIEKTGETRSWSYPDGLRGYLGEAMSDQELAVPIFAMEKFVQKGGDSGYAEGEGAAWAIVWSAEGAIVRESYVNLIPTWSGGTHDAGLRDGVFNAVKNFAELHGMLPKGIKLVPDDVFSRASFVLSARVLDPQFQGQTKDRLVSRDALRLAFLLFGALWAFDAWWKWQPGFLGQMASFLGAAQAGQPGWIVSWIGLFVLVMRTIGPFAFAVLAALTESAVAISVLFAHRLPLKWLRIALVLGLLYSLMLWTTAEGFGGPYGPGFTGNKGDVLGTTNVYSIIFLFMLAILWRPRQGHVQNTHADAGWRE